MDGWHPGESNDYDPGACLDLAHLAAFLASTQPETASALSLDQDTPTRRQFLARVKSQIDGRGIIDVLRNGVQHQQHNITLFFGSPSPGNTQAAERHRPEPVLSDPAVAVQQRQQAVGPGPGSLINGLPIATMELKNSLTKQTAADAVEQYRNTRNPRETSLPHRALRRPLRRGRPGSQVLHRAGPASSRHSCPSTRATTAAPQPGQPRRHQDVLPLAGTLNPVSLTDIIENYAQKVGNRQIWPRYHQLDLVRRILADVKAAGAGQKYLVQHSAAAASPIPSPGWPASS